MPDYFKNTRTFILSRLSTLDVFLTITLCFLAALVLPFYFLYVILHTLYLRQKYNKAVDKFKNRKLMILSEASPYRDIARSGTLEIFREWLHDGYFQHMYVVVLNATKYAWHNPFPEITFIDIPKLAPNLKRRGLPIISTLINGLGYLYSLLGLRKLIVNEITVLRGANPHHMGVITTFLGKLTGVPHCISIHSDNDANYELMKEYWRYSHHELFGSRNLSQVLMRFSYKLAPQIWVIRKYLAKEALKYGARKDKIRLFPHSCWVKNFIDRDPEMLRRELALNEKKIVLSVGRLAPENYPYDILKIAHLVASQEVIFVIVGNGPLETDIRQKARDLGIENWIIFTGGQPHQRIPFFRSLADVNLVLRGGYSLIEAALSAKPIVCYDVDWHSELIQDGQTGFLIPEYDVEGAAQAILTLLDNDDLAKRLGLKARRLAIDHHSYEKVTSIKIGLYEELIKEFAKI